MEPFLASNPGLASRFSPDRRVRELLVPRAGHDRGEHVHAAPVRAGRGHRGRLSPRTSRRCHGTPASATAAPPARCSRRWWTDRRSGWPTQPQVSERDLRCCCRTDVVRHRRGDGRASAADRTTTRWTRLGDMVGLAEVKREVADMVNLITTARHRAAAGLPVPSLSHHLVFAGPPGYRQDHRRPPLRRGAGRSSACCAGPAGRGGPRRPGRPLHRAHRPAHPRGLRTGPRRRAVHRRGVHPDPARAAAPTSARRRSTPW